MSNNRPNILTPGLGFKPFKYPWAYDRWTTQQRIHWLPEEVPLAEDVKDWAVNLNDSERNLLTHIFRFFTQSDIEVQDNYMTRLGQLTWPTEVKMMLASFANMECFDDQSELLTAQGWKNVADITDKDIIAQYDIPSKQISFVLPKKVVSYAYKGVMHHYDGLTTDICVTPNHELIATRHNGSVIKSKSLERILGRNYTYPASGGTYYGKQDVSTLDSLLVAIQADGCLRGMCPSAGEWRTVDFILHKTRKIERLTKLLEDLGVKYSLKREATGRVHITFNMPDGVDISSIKDFGFIEISKISSRYAISLLHEIIFWDGTVNKITGQRSYYTTRKAAADIVQAIVTLTGQSMATIGINRNIGATVKLPQGCDYVLEKPCYVVSITDRRTEKTYPHKKDIQYDGRVYCVSVETENLVSRRNGKVAFTGNTIHIDAYSKLIETIGMPEATYSQFMEYEELKQKHDLYATFAVDSPENIAKTLAMFGGFAEGVQIFSSFAILMNFPRFNKMKGMGQIVSWSVRDESLHCDGITDIFRTYCNETGILSRGLKAEIYDMAELVVSQEDKFIDLAFEAGPIEGLSPDEMKTYLRFMTDYRLRGLGLKPIFKSGRKHPLPWLTPLLSGPEHANFFEARATEYSKAATRGEWSDVWKGFDVN